ncbi:hypothetical protein BWQ96_09962 [Gracilariopsis chorda]|uniref:Uncharacterized protein n=1 Tax=Gracilariopsis chorda TaxID=448386 RepID=A0A2V3IDZ8_9FLOR|nr:hypothetical protein BWQ96_09962 [Gracilariopsis chorda]|eukprot:PXF40306.1 hypothetical protein BWQ96_09962 [Gracilariopsis chorda]
MWYHSACQERRAITRKALAQTDAWCTVQGLRNNRTGRSVAQKETKGEQPSEIDSNGAQEQGSAIYKASKQSLFHLRTFLGALLVSEALVDVGDDTAAGNSGLDQTIKFLISSNGKLQVAGGYTLDLEILAGISGELENFRREVLEDGGRVDGSGGSHTLLATDAVFQVAMDSANWELKAGSRGSGDDLFRLG